MMQDGEFTVRAIRDRSLERDVISIKTWDTRTSWNMRLAVDDAEILARKMLRAVTFARTNECDPA